MLSSRRCDYARYRTDPAGYARDVLGVVWWDKQREIAEALLRPPHRVLVKASHSVGKSHLMGGLVNWWFDTRSPGVCLTTAPTFRQVQDVLWKEIRRQRRGRGGFPGPKLPRLEDAPDHFASGLTATNATAFQGQHELAILILLDEAVGVDREIWEAADSMVMGVEYGIVAVCNPTDAGSEFYAREQAGGWHTVHIPCLDHPNIAAEVAGRPPPYPSAVRLAWLEERLRDWCTPTADPLPSDIEWPPGSGSFLRPGPLAEARLLGRWPSAASGVWSDALWGAVEVGAGEPGADDRPEIGCFVAGTLIDTETGLVPIEDVKEGDKVLTRRGYQRVKAAFCTGVQATVTVTCEDGRTLTGTGDHPIWDGSGWRNLDSLMSGDTVTTWKESNTTALYSAETRNLSGIGTGDTSSLAVTGNRFPFIGTSGRISTGRYREGRSFTTRTGTPATTTSTTWNASRHRAIRGTTMSLIVSGILPPLGIRVTRGGRGIGKWPSGGSRGLPLLALAKSAVPSIPMSLLPHQSFAPASASRHSEGGGESTKKSEHVKSAARRSCAASTNLPQLVPVRVLTKSRGGHERVYNLTVEGCPEYFANGILVHNCDVARFGDDNTEFVVRCGPAAMHHEWHNGWGTDQTAGRLKQLCREWAVWATTRLPTNAAPIDPTAIRVKVDDDGVGGGVIDQAGGFAFLPVSAGSSADAPDDYPNRRSELWFAAAEWARQGRMNLAGLSVESRRELKRQAMAPRYKLDAAGRRVVEPKSDTKKKLGRSPDGMDALNLAYYDSPTPEVAAWVDTGPAHRSARDRHGRRG